VSGDLSEESQEQKVPDENLILLPRWVVAYSLQDRMFVIVETLHLNRLEDTGDPFKELAITPGHKKVIWSLVHSTLRSEEWNRHTASMISVRI
jgi:hypothetical protein